MQYNQHIDSQSSKKKTNKSKNTPPKFNIAPETCWLEDDPFPLGGGELLNFSGVIPKNTLPKTKIGH